jgi:SAM-dependent methyltransferase
MTVPSLLTKIAPDEFEYEPFANDTGRNGRQESLEVPAFVAALGIPRGVRILEVGCGRGIALTGLSRQCAPTRLVGLDIDAALLVEAAENNPGIDVELVCADVRGLPFDDASFDVVIDFGTCYHIGRPAQALSEIARVLAPGGLFCHETPVSQVLSHPRRWGGRGLPWDQVPELHGGRRALLWSSREREVGIATARRSARRARRAVRAGDR